MIVFRKARNPQQTLNDLDAYLRTVGDKPVRWLAREVQSWGEFSYDEIAALIESGQLDALIDWQERWAGVVNQTLAPMWLKAIEEASRKATKGMTVLSDSNDYVKAWVSSHGGELITLLSDESRKAISNILLRGQGLRMAPRDIAKDIRPLIGLTDRQAQANLKYKNVVYQKLLDNGMSESKARERSEAAALKYAGKQHRYRAESIVLTENAFAYNRGAHMGVSQSIADGYMGRCEMVWTTAGTNRVCGRCMELKDTVVGTTDQSGVTIPPLHPRCRCAIMYREVGTPRVMQPKPKMTEESTSSGTASNSSSGASRQQNVISLKDIGVRSYAVIQITLANAPCVKAAQVWGRFENNLKVGGTNELNMLHSGGVLYLNLARLKVGEDIATPYQLLFHEGAHGIDFLNRIGDKFFSEHYKNGAFLEAIRIDLTALVETKRFECKQRLEELLKKRDYVTLRKEHFISGDDLSVLGRVKISREEKEKLWQIIESREIRLEALQAKFADEMNAKHRLLDRADFSDIFNGYTNGKFHFGANHKPEYWEKNGDHARCTEAFAGFLSSAIANRGSWQILNQYLLKTSKVFEDMLDELLK